VKYAILEHLAHKLDKAVKAARRPSAKSLSAHWDELTKLHAGDIAEVIYLAEESTQNIIFSGLKGEQQALVFKRLKPHVQAFIARSVGFTKINPIIQTLSADVLADFYNFLSGKEKIELMKALDKKVQRVVSNHLSWKAHSVGRIMSTDVPMLKEELSIKRCITSLQKQGRTDRRSSLFFLTNRSKKLTGYINSSDLLAYNPMTKLKEIALTAPTTLAPEENQQVAVKQLERYGVNALPVIDNNKELIGVVTMRDVIEVMRKKATIDALNLSGVVTEDSEEALPSIIGEVGRRISWLVGLLLFQSISSMIMSRYEDMLQSNVILPLFLTMLIGTGGNAGNQSATMIIRGLVTGDVSSRNRWKILGREFLVALLLGVLLFAVALGRVYLFHQDIIGAFTVSASLFCIVVTSVMLGTTIPLVLSKFKIDPTYSAAPFLATIMDIAGVQIYCMIAYMLLVN
jgi:magnesium transporter